MKRAIVLLSSLVLLAACVDTTGISPVSSKIPAGDPNASVVVTEYGDFQCPACHAVHKVITQPLLQKYGSKIRFDFKQFPLLTIHPLSMPLAEGSECAADQAKFWDYVDWAYTTEVKASVEITDWAKKANLDMDLFDRCTRSHIKKKAIMDEFTAGRELKVGGTPTFFVNGQLVEKNDLASFSDVIDAALTNTKLPNL